MGVITNRTHSGWVIYSNIQYNDVYTGCIEADTPAGGTKCITETSFIESQLIQCHFFLKILLKTALLSKHGDVFYLGQKTDKLHKWKTLFFLFNKCWCNNHHYAEW